MKPAKLALFLLILGASPAVAAVDEPVYPPPQIVPLDIVIGQRPMPTAPVLDPALPQAELWAGERAAQRFAQLRRLADEQWIKLETYEIWAQRNRGAFLLLTAPPPAEGLAGKIPSYEEMIAYLGEANHERGDIAAIERKTLLDSLMLPKARTASMRRPPADADALARWLTLLDRVQSEQLLPPEQIVLEKNAIARVIAP